MKKVLLCLVLVFPLLMMGCESDEVGGKIGTNVTDPKEIVYNDAVTVWNAARIYCEEEQCTDDQELTVSDVDEYTDSIDWNLYDTSATNNIVAIKDQNEWFVTLERVGTGDYEWPFDLVPINNTSTEAEIDDD